MFLKEVENPDQVKVESVSKEIEKYKELDILQKPVDIYLKHCKEYAAQYLQRNTIRITDYQFTRKDMEHRTVTNKFQEIFELQRAETAVDPKLADKEISEQFTTESIKVFTDIIKLGDKSILMAKTWQKITFNCKVQATAKA